MKMIKNDGIDRDGELWRQRYAQNLVKKGKKTCPALWEDMKYAERYDDNARIDDWRRGKRLVREMRVTASSTVLDIGAGPGTLAIPAAKLVRHVAAVEPAAGMMWHLRKNVEEQGLDNVTCVQKRWEDTDLSQDLDAPYDVVVASLSLGMPDIVSALEKMDMAAAKYAYIFWPAGITFWERNYAEVWQALHGEEYRQGLKCDYLMNILYGMGIYPNVKVYQDEYLESYSGLSEAVDHFKPFYGVEDGRQEGILRELLSRKLKKQGERLVLRGYSHMGKLWWKKDRALKE